MLSRECADRPAELERFKRCMRTLGSFTHAMHRAAGVEVRGVQAEAMAMSARAREQQAADAQPHPQVPAEAEAAVPGGERK